jgi:diguanylate cyclase (GGDEF)-like protein/PAS domain S-box-containing protein
MIDDRSLIEELQKENARLRRQIAALEQALQAARTAQATAEAEQQQMYAVWMQTPTPLTILRGPELVFELANSAYAEMVGTYRQILGRTVQESFPELAGQDMIERLAQVYTTGEPWLTTETPVLIEKVDQDIERWYNLHHHPLRDAQGHVIGIISHCQDVTPQVLARRELEIRNREVERLNSELRQSQELLQRFIEHSPAVVFVVDTASRFLLVNQQFEFALKRQADQILGRTDAELFDAATAHATRARDLEVLTTGEPVAYEQLLPLADGLHIFLAIKFPIFDAQGEVYAVGGIATDITERKQMEEALRISEQRYRSLVELSPDGIAIIQEERFVYMNQQGLRILGTGDPAELLHRPILDRVHADHRDLAQTRLDQVQHDGQRVNFVEIKITRLDGQMIDVEIAGAPIIYQDQPAVHIIFRDITERKTYEAQIQHLAFTDALTGLPNRRRLYDLGDAVLEAPHSTAGNTALLYLDLNRFKAINDTLGHDTGDALLVQVAMRLEACIRTSDTLARLGGDEFAVLLPDSTLIQARAVAERMLERLTQPFDLQGQLIHLGGSIGIAVSTAGDTPFSTLLSWADIAMYRAKAAGGGIQIYDATLNPLRPDQLQLEADLRHALTIAALEVWYQPIIDLTHNQVIAVEALIRWPHPTRGMLTPDAFLPLAEEVGLLRALDHLVLKTALQQAATWTADGHRLDIAINLTAPSLQRADLISELASLIQTTGVPANQIIIELTEYTALRDLLTIQEVLTGLRDLGVRVALDDFGTGYASLSHLRQLPVDVLKLDRAFATGIGRDPRDEAVVQALMALGQGLNLMVIVEGVEEAAQLEWLRLAGCHYVQGYLISAPVTAANVAQLLTAAY